MDGETAAFLVFDSLDNIPSELLHLLDELRSIDYKSTEWSRKIRNREHHISKHIRTHGSLQIFQKEDQYIPKMRADYAKAIEKTYEKEALAKRALELIDRTIKKLDEETRKIVLLEGSGGSGLSSGLGTPTAAASPLAQSYTPAHHAASATPSHAPNSAQSHPPANGHNSPVKSLKRARSNMPRPLPGSALAGPPLLPNGYPAPPKDRGLDHDDEEGGEDTTTYCFCEQVSYGEMVACDNDSCAREWFHYGCVGLKEPPIGKWYCSECVERKKLKRS
jgi:chromatin modification-related protein YNG2